MEIHEIQNINEHEKLQYNVYVKSIIYLDLFYSFYPPFFSNDKDRIEISFIINYAHFCCGNLYFIRFESLISKGSSWNKKDLINKS